MSKPVVPNLGATTYKGAASYSTSMDIRPILTLGWAGEYLSNQVRLPRDTKGQKTQELIL